MSDLGARTYGTTWEILTYAGEQPAWISELARRIQVETGATGRVVGIVGRQHDDASRCEAAWKYDALRKRIAHSLAPKGTVSDRDAGSTVDTRIALGGEVSGLIAHRSLVLMIDAYPAADLRRALESAMIEGRGEVKVSCQWREANRQGTEIWRCGLVEWSIAISLERVVEKLQGLILHCLLLREARPDTQVPGWVSPGDTVPAQSRGGPLGVALAQARRRLTSCDQWAITVYQNVDVDVLWPTRAGIQLVPPIDRFWADPFVARDDDERLWVFFEELKFASPRGTLRCVAIDARGNAGEPIDVLTEPCHLSYPNVFKSEGDWYLLPESSERKNLMLYRARRFPDDWEPIAELLTDTAVVDATLHRDANGWWMFAGAANSKGAAFDDTMHLYRSSTLSGPWLPAQANPVRVDPSCSRPGGQLFRWRGKWLRPVQDCRGRYGRFVHLMEFAGVGERGPQEHVVATLAGVDAFNVQAAHTYNRVGTDLAVDWQRWRSRWGGTATLDERALAFTLWKSHSSSK